MSDEIEIKVGSRWHNVTTGCELLVTSIVRGEIYYTFVFGPRDGRCDNCPEKAFRRYYEHVSDPKEPTPAVPPHYDFPIQPIDAVEAWDLNHRLSCAVEYIARHKGKGGLDDLRKARWFLGREIAKQKEAKAS